jgi:NADPH:quinone reductase-like Zn-dependent oxidoreductase/uncharacterized protein YndB with AHSA1/START domain
MIRIEETTVIDRPIEEVWAILRDFNGHDRWHPAVATSQMQLGKMTDQVSGVRDFRLAGGERVAERLLKLSDKTHSFSYTITEADVPLYDYVAHVELKPVTARRATFWRWHCKFRAPHGQEDDLRALVANGVYRAGFQGLRSYMDANHVLQEPSAPPTGDAQRRDRNALSGKGVVVTRHGGPEVLQYGEVEALPPGPGAVRIAQEAIGVNYIDVYCRTGYFNLIDPPGVPGMEAAGTVVDVGPGVRHLRAGDKVAYACAPPGAYGSVRTMPAELVVPLPPGVDAQTAAGVLLKGVTAWFLLHKVHRLQKGETALVYAPAGGVGRLLVEWAHALGATVIGATSSQRKADLARVSGAAHVVMPGAVSLEDQVRELTDGAGVDVVFDAVGRDSFDHSIAALKPCGHLVSFGQASGDIGSRNIGAFAATSLTLSRPNYGHYTDTRAKITEGAEAVFDALMRGKITSQIGQTFPLSQAAEAHRALEARGTYGSTLLLPEAS